ncbi:DUF1571 domain-containing protein [Sesbania bispinosa]|nr:DUF1571 domain-containing protein [Sesbania bispinosa]
MRGGKHTKLNYYYFLPTFPAVELISKPKSLQISNSSPKTQKIGNAAQFELTISIQIDQTTQNDNTKPSVRVRSGGRRKRSLSAHTDKVIEIVRNFQRTEEQHSGSGPEVRFRTAEAVCFGSEAGPLPRQMRSLFFEAGVLAIEKAQERKMGM